MFNLSSISLALSIVKERRALVNSAINVYKNKIHQVILMHVQRWRFNDLLLKNCFLH